MELIKDMTKQFYPLLILLSAFAFVVWVFFSAPINDGNGVLEGSGRLYTHMLDTAEASSDGLNFLAAMSQGYVPEVKYIAGAQSVGESVVFKHMLSVRKEDGTYVSGDTEDEFAIYLIDIQTPSGNSVLETLTSQEINSLEEIPAAFVYNKEDDRLYFHCSGSYIIRLRIYGSCGGQTTYEFMLPVEAS